MCFPLSSISVNSMCQKLRKPFCKTHYLWFLNLIIWYFSVCTPWVRSKPVSSTLPFLEHYKCAVELLSLLIKCTLDYNALELATMLSSTGAYLSFWFWLGICSPNPLYSSILPSFWSSSFCGLHWIFLWYSHFRTCAFLSLACFASYNVSLVHPRILFFLTAAQ